MYLLERIIGVSVYVIVMLYFSYSIYKSKGKKISQYLIAYCFLLAILAYFYVPASSADLSRYIKSTHLYTSLPLSKLSSIILESKSPMQVIYFYLIGLTKLDGLIAAITSLLFYGFGFSILNDAYKRFKLSNKSIALSLLFFMEMGGFLSVISVIRCFVAFAAIAYSCYFEIIANKSFIKHLPLYICASLMHPAAMALTIIRIFALLLKKENKIYKKILNYCLVFILLTIIVLYGNEYIQLIFEKADIYINGNIYSYIWEYVICMLFMIFSSCFLIYCKRFFNKNGLVKIINFINFILFINLIIFAFCFEYNIFTRFQIFSSILFLPMFPIILCEIEKDKKNSKLLTFTFTIISILIFVIACTRGNLCGYKFLIFN